MGRQVARLLGVSCCVLVLGACQADPGYQGRSSADWIAEMRAGDAERREMAALALGNVLAINPKLARPITALVAALADTSDAVRLAASRALAQPGVAAMDALPGLAGMLRDTAHVEVRLQGVRALGRLAAGSNVAERQRVVQTLAPAHLDPEPGVRGAVAQALSSAFTAAPRSGGRGGAGASDWVNDAVGILAVLAADSSADVRGDAVTALGDASVFALRSDAAVWRAAIQQAVRDPVAEVRAAAITALRRDRTAIAAAEESLVQALGDSVLAVRLSAVHALGELPAPQSARVTSRLRAVLADPDSLVRAEAAHALAGFHARGGRDPSPPEPSLAERCQHLPPRTRGC